MDNIIAEGNGKGSPNDRARFLDISRGSALECAAIQDVLVASGGQGVYLDEGDCEHEHHPLQRIEHEHDAAAEKTGIRGGTSAKLQWRARSAYRNPSSTRD